jgi:hypothetical protein
MPASPSWSLCTATAPNSWLRAQQLADLNLLQLVAQLKETMPCVLVDWKQAQIVGNTLYKLHHLVRIAALQPRKPFIGRQW